MKEAEYPISKDERKCDVGHGDILRKSIQNSSDGLRIEEGHGSAENAIDAIRMKDYGRSNGCVKKCQVAEEHESYYNNYRDIFVFVHK